MKPSPNVTELRRLAEARLLEREDRQRSEGGELRSEADTQRLVHELQVHQVELEMQNEELQKTREELEAALALVKSLSGLLPICCDCKKIRDDQGNWKPVEIYIRQHSEAKFTHSLCPDCLPKYFPDGQGEEVMRNP
jgi:hypothetical protein